MNLRFRRPSPALVISLIALFVAMGGVGYAAVKINGKNIKNNSIPGKKLKNSAVATKKLKNGAVSNAKVKNNALTGAKINEATLGEVPSATNADHATTADSIDGTRLQTFKFFNDNPNVAATNVFQAAGLNLSIGCTGFLPIMNATTSTSGAQIRSYTVAAGAATPQNGISDFTFNTGETYDLLALNTFGSVGTTIYRAADGTVVTITWQFGATNANTGCAIYGTAVIG